MLAVCTVESANSCLEFFVGCFYKNWNVLTRLRIYRNRHRPRVPRADVRASYRWAPVALWIQRLREQCALHVGRRVRRILNEAWSLLDLLPVLQDILLVWSLRPRIGHSVLRDGEQAIAKPMPFVNVVEESREISEAQPSVCSDEIVVLAEALQRHCQGGTLFAPFAWMDGAPLVGIPPGNGTSAGATLCNLPCARTCEIVS
ncbi:unnamed protein product [Symbiodinium sp. CCMP2592]|nr:unnamed protein product [Symbiodinium sp. CCMP2592]